MSSGPPTDDYELPQWWTNNEQLLHLHASGAYALYDGTNRYHRPIERGRWAQPGYAALWLEPYAELPREAARASISKSGPLFRLSYRSFAPMVGLEAPPAVLEDRLIGSWQSDAHQTWNQAGGSGWAIRSSSSG